MERRIKFIGLDVYNEMIAVAVAEDGRDGEIRFHGTIASTAEAVRGWLFAWADRGSSCAFATRRARSGSA